MQAVIIAIAAVVGLGLSILLLNKVEDLGEFDIAGFKVNTVPIAIILVAVLAFRGIYQRQSQT